MSVVFLNHQRLLVRKQTCHIYSKHYKPKYYLNNINGTIKFNKQFLFYHVIVF